MENSLKPDLMSFFPGPNSFDVQIFNNDIVDTLWFYSTTFKSWISARGGN